MAGPKVARTAGSEQGTVSVGDVRFWKPLNLTPTDINHASLNLNSELARARPALTHEPEVVRTRKGVVTARHLPSASGSE